jgi:hypothetical protein
MREETARQVEGMRQAANAEIESRRDVAQAMKEDAAYTKAANEKNFQIQTANSNRQIQGLQAQARRDQEQFNANAQANETIFKSIASLSQSAGVIVDRIQEEQKKERRKTERLAAESQETDVDKLAYRIASQWQLAETSAAITGAVNENIANGGDEYVGEKVKSQNQAIAVDANEGQIYKLFSVTYGQAALKRIQAIEAERGRLSPEEVAYELNRFRGELYDQIDIDRFDNDFLKPALDQANTFDRNLLATRRREFIAASKSNRKDRAKGNILNSRPDTFNRVVTTAYNEIVDANNGDRAASWDELEQDVFNQIDEKGNFVLSIEQIAQFPIYTEEGKPPETFGKKFEKTRFANIQRERVKIQNEYRTQQKNADTLSNAELEDTLARAVMENPTIERLEEAKRMYTATALKESPKLAVIEKHLTYTAQHKNNIISAVTKLRDFELTPEIVSAAVAANPTEGAAIKQRYEAYNAKWKSEGYKDANKSLETLVSGTTSFGTTKAAEAGSLPMIGHLKAELRNRTAMYEPALGFEAAHQKAANELANEYRNGYRNKDTKFYRKVSRNGTVSYPNLPVGAEQTRRDIGDLRTSVKTLGVEGVLDTPLSVTSAERLEYIKQMAILLG